MQPGHVASPHAPPVAALPEPDAWSARWTIVLAVVGIAAWILPTPVPSPGPRGTYDGGYAWWFPWSPELTAARPLALRLVQPVAAGAALLILFLLRGAWRGMALLAVALAAFLASPYFPWGRGGPEAFAGPAPGDDPVRAFLALGLLVGVVGIAVGNHVRKRAAGAGLGRALCGLGGALVVLAFFVPVDGPPTIREFFDSEKVGLGWPMFLVYVLILAYGGLGLRHLAGGHASGWTCVWTSRLGRILLVVPPIGRVAVLVALYASAAAALRPPLYVLSATTAKEWGLLVGIFAPIGVGLAAWLDGRILARRSGPADPAPVA